MESLASSPHILRAAGLWTPQGLAWCPSVSCAHAGGGGGGELLLEAAESGGGGGATPIAAVEPSVTVRGASGE